jgi:DNA-binding response OmpR family regulator
MPEERILVVEDDAAVAQGLIYGLKSEGFQVRWVIRGREALEAAHADHPHLILLDIRLPDISGFDVCRQLRAEGAKLPILMLTAKDEEVDKVLGLELGADDYIVKPYSLREVVSRSEIIERVWGYSGDIGSDRTVDVHIRHLRQKLEDDAANPRWIQTIRGVGYTFTP